MQRLASACCLWLLCTVPAKAYYYKQYTTSQSLISNNVYHCLSDHNGYMWFFTDRGISKFDGARFRNFTAFDGLTDNEIFAAHEDRHGRLWLFTYNGTPCFIRNDTVYNSGNCALLKKIPCVKYLESVYEASDSVLYFGYIYGQLLKVTPSGSSWIAKLPRSYGKLASLSGSNDMLIAHMANCDVYIKAGTIVRVDAHEPAIVFFDFHYMLSLDSGGLNIGQGRQPIWKLRSRQVTMGNILHLYYDEDKHLFCSMQNGLAIINTQTNAADRLLDNLTVTCVGRDIYGNYWVTTHGNGIYYLDKHLDEVKALPVDNAAGIFATGNRQCFFVENNLVYYFSGDSLCKFRSPVKSNIKFEPLLLAGKYFFYNAGNVCYCYRRDGGDICRVQDAFKNAYEMAPGRFLLAGRQPCILTLINGRCTEVRLPFAAEVSCFDSISQNLYYSCGNNVYVYNNATGQNAIIDSLPGQAEVRHLYAYRGKIVMLVNKPGIIVYDPYAGYKKTVCQTGRVCYDVYEMGDRYLLATNAGYYLCTALDRPEISRVETPIHEPDILFMYPLGQHILCNANGFYYKFDSRLLNKDTITPALFIDNIVVNGKQYTGLQVTVKNQLRVQLAVSLSTLKYFGPGIYFTYRIIHNSDTGQWYRANADKLDILLQKYGDYTLALYAVTENGRLSAPGYVGLNMVPPFYATGIFLKLMILFAGIVVLVGVRLYNNYRVKLFNEELSFLQVENKAINALLNPHFVFNAINNIQALVNTGSKEKANNYLAVLSRLIRQNIDNLQFNFIPLREEMQLVNNYVRLQNLRFDNKINLQTHIPENAGDVQIPPLLIHTFAENAIVHGFRNAPGSFNLDIDIAWVDNDYLSITIADNGAGFDTHIPGHNKDADIVPLLLRKKKTSLGIAFTRRRLQRLSEFCNARYALDIHSLPGHGATVKVLVYAGFSEAIIGG